MLRSAAVVLARTRNVVGLAGLCAALGSAFALARCSGDTTPCDPCSDVTATPLTVALTPAEIWIHPSDAKPVAVALARSAAGTGDVTVTIETDAGFTADPLTIADGKNDGTLVVHVPTSFTQGQATLLVDAKTASASAQASLIVHVAGASGTLDTSFGAAGVADLAPGSGDEFGRAMIVLQSGVLVGLTHIESASSVKVLRLTAAGAADATFATTTTAPDAMSEIRSLAMLTDGRIYAAGYVAHSKFDVAAVRIAAAGGLDPTYAVDDSLSSVDDVAYAAGIQPGGLLVGAGETQSAVTVMRWTQAPLPPPDAGPDANSDADASVSDADAEASPNTAHLDPAFGDSGAAIAPLVPSIANALVVGADGSLYAIGEANSTIDAIAVHFSASGALDVTYGDAGVALLTGAHGAVAAILEPSGDIVVATSLSLFRLSPKGAPGAPTALATNVTPHTIARDPASGAIYVGGNQGSSGCFVSRYTSALALDASFASAGTLAWNPADSCAVAALGVDDDGKIVVLTNVTKGLASHAAVARYWP